MEKSGIFSLIEINDKESKLLLTYLRNTNKTSAYDLINYLIGIDYLQFLDLLAGNTLKIPSRKSIYRDLEYIKIYNFVKEKKFSTDSIRTVAKLYTKNISFVKRAIIKISKSLNEELPITMEELNSIKYIIEDNSCNNKYELENIIEKEIQDE